MPLNLKVAGMKFVPRNVREWDQFFRGQVTVTPDDDSVGAIQLENDAVTTLKIIDDAVTLAKLAEIATSRLLGRITAGDGNPEVLTGIQAGPMIAAGYNDQVAAASQAEAEAGTEAAIRRFSPLRIAQAIANLTAISREWSFVSPGGASGTFYAGGFYQFHSSAFTPAGGTNVGTANSSYASHGIVVLGASSTDMVVRITGTSINDQGVRAASATEDIDTSGGSANDYFETAKKWIGQVSYTLLSGTGVTINAGFAKYWDNNNKDFSVTGFEVTWLAGANDSAANIELFHHKTTGWTYGAGGSPTLPTAIASMNTDHVTEINLVNGQCGAWKRDNLSQAIDGDGAEGIVWRVTTTANKAFEYCNLSMRCGI